MYNEYEESFYYDKPSSVGSAVTGEAVGLGLGLGAGLISTVLSGLLFLISRMDVLSSLLLALLSYMLTYRFEWNGPVYIIGSIVIIAVSMLLQHTMKVFRVIYGLFSCAAISLLAPAFIGYSTDASLYRIMAICFGVTAVWSFISWKCIIGK